ncbi:hypothetical protein D9619_011568 [Psilocybe cf. subviscida]|uniref:NACHT domain-containing protein n=1 Tax=Psilocybe cf. subviscida TaxID=2480587 RepID=A0A8H5F9H7_9AGAR|nr:hypothetical protein D9619_011568 [Psilocybe cf. subviscida]
MASSRIPPLNQAKASSESNRKDSNRWTTLKSSLVLGLTATQMALDGLPIPGAKGCVSLILHLVKTTDLTFGNAEALEALQSRLESLHEALSPVYANPDIEVPDDLGKGVRNLAVSLDKLAAKWKHRLEKKQRKRDFILRMLTAEDDRDSLTTFANSVEQAIQDFLVITITNGRTEKPEHCTYYLVPPLLHTILHEPVTIREWARNPNPNQPPMFWLNGLAGIGKTTIAHTMASELDAAGLLGASFVFLRADDQLKDACLVFPTLAFQLAQFDSRFRTALVEVLEHDPDCGSKRLDLQFASLFLRPFSAISLSAPMVIILDALDECEPEKLTSALLRILLKNIKKIPFLRIFITSRPEGYIRKALDLVDSSSPHQKLVLHENIHAKEVENDIRLFLRLRLQEIWDERTNRTSHRWPSEGNLEKLVRQSGRLFVYAATAVRFIGGNGALNLNRQLSTLLRVKIGHVPQSEPYQQLDGLYLQILDSVFPDSGDKYYIQRFRKVVGSIVLLERPLPLGSLANLLDCSIDDIKETLYHLHSIIIVPATNSEAPRTYHLSFPNFITNSDRCTNSKPYIDPSQQAEYLFGRCLAFLEKDFGPVLVNSLDADVTQDIHQLQSDTNTVKEITMTPLEEEPLTDSDDRSAQTHISLEDDIEDYHLAPEIRYSDNYWCRHLMNIPTGNQEAAHALERFVGRYLSKWLQRRKIRILANFGAPNVRLAGDTFDIIHDVHRWGSHSGCSNQFRMFLRQSAKDLYVQLFPDARVGYLFGKRLNPEDVAQSVTSAPALAPPSALTLIWISVLVFVLVFVVKAPVFPLVQAPTFPLVQAPAFPLVLAPAFPLILAFALALAPTTTHSHNPPAEPSTPLSVARGHDPDHNSAIPLVLVLVLTFAFAPSAALSRARGPDHNPAAALVLVLALAPPFIWKTLQCGRPPWNPTVCQKP